jgi:hypothetical protein
VEQNPRHRDFSLPDAMPLVWYGRGDPSAEGLLYIPRLNYLAICSSLDDFRLSFRTEGGERLPEEIETSLRRLAGVIGDGGLSDSENEERIAAENSLSKLREAQAAFEKHDLPEPKLLARLQIDLTRVRNELSLDSPEPPSQFDPPHR